MEGFPSTWKHAERQIRQVKACSQTTHQTDRREEERRGRGRVFIEYLVLASRHLGEYRATHLNCQLGDWLAVCGL